VTRNFRTPLHVDPCLSILCFHHSPAPSRILINTIHLPPLVFSTAGLQPWRKLSSTGVCGLSAASTTESETCRGAPYAGTLPYSDRQEELLHHANTLWRRRGAHSDGGALLRLTSGIRVAPSALPRTGSDGSPSCTVLTAPCARQRKVLLDEGSPRVSSALVLPGEEDCGPPVSVAAPRATAHSELAPASDPALPRLMKPPTRPSIQRRLLRSARDLFCRSAYGAAHARDAAWKSTRMKLVRQQGGASSHGRPYKFPRRAEADVAF
jgi:hypothetical protein